MSPSLLVKNPGPNNAQNLIPTNPSKKFGRKEEIYVVKKLTALGISHRS